MRIAANRFIVLSALLLGVTVAATPLCLAVVTVGNSAPSATLT